jgi:hypothetical protein
VELDLRLPRRRGWRGLCGFLRRLLLLALLLLLLKLLLLFLLRQMMPDHAARRSACNAMMARDVPCDTANDSTLDAAFGCRGFRADEECNAEQWYGEQLQLRVDSSRHAVTPFSAHFDKTAPPLSVAALATVPRQDGT